MSIFTLKKKDNSESLVYMKHAHSLEEAYPMLHQHDNLRGCGISIAVPDVENMSAWESILKKCGFPDIERGLDGLDGEDRLAAILRVAEDNNLIAAQFAYDYKFSAPLDSEPFQTLNSKSLVDRLIRGVQSDFDQEYDAAEVHTRIGRDAAGQVKMLMNGRITTTLDCDIHSIQNRIESIAQSNLKDANVHVLAKPDITVAKADMDGTELTLRRKLKFRF